MTHPKYTQQSLSRYTLPRLKRIAAERGVTPTLDMLRSIRLCGGCVPLHRLQFEFSNSVIQTLLDKELVQVQNTGRGFLLEIAEDF
jgi:hypothetical protein